jgi:hypothetical protein
MAGPSRIIRRLDDDDLPYVASCQDLDEAKQLLSTHQVQLKYVSRDETSGKDAGGEEL